MRRPSYLEQCLTRSRGVGVGKSQDAAALVEQGFTGPSDSCHLGNVWLCFLCVLHVVRQCLSRLVALRPVTFNQDAPGAFM